MNKLWVALLSTLLAMPVWGAQNLLETYAQALRNDTELASAQAALGAAEARHRRARGQLLPRLSASAGYSYLKRSRPVAGGGGGDRSSIMLNLSQALFNWTAWQNMDAADARSTRAQVLLSATEQALIVRTARAYFEVLSARDALQATRERQNAIRQQLQRAQAAFDSGLAPVMDKQEARSSLDAARVDAIAAENRLATTRRKLRALTGRTPRQLAGIAAHEPLMRKQQSQSAKAWLQRALQHAPSLRAAQATVTAARQEVAAARGQRYPDISLVGSVGRNEQAVPQGGVETWMVGLQLEVPLFAGGTINAAVDEAGFTAEQARLDQVAARRQLRLEVDTAWRNVGAAADRVAALDQAIKSARTAVAAAQAGHRLGNRTILDVIEAETELVQRKAERKQGWYDHAVARLQLRQAAGVLDFAALTRVNRRLTPQPDGPESTGSPG